MWLQMTIYLRCSYRNAGLKRAFLCKVCHGVTWGNRMEDLGIMHEEDEDVDQNIFDIFD